MRRVVVLWGVVALLLPGLAVSGARAQDADAEPFYDIVVVGGEQAVSADVFTALEASTSGNVVRVSGPDRYATAAAVSEISNEPGVPVVFVATGEEPPDALVAGPVAAQEGGPVLLVRHGSVPDATRRELERLGPQAVVALGGTDAISDGVLDELGDIAGTPPERVAGETRFSTAAEVSRAYYSPGVPLVYVATGLTFADALAVGPAAAVDGAPVLLTGSAGLPPATVEELERLRPRDIIVLGGRGAVGPQVEADLAEYATGSVERIGGATREDTAAQISEHAFPAGAGIVFLATGADFPDALAIGAAAGAAPHNRFGLLGGSSSAAGETPGPVLLTRPNSLPAETAAELLRLGQAVPGLVAHDQEVTTAFETPVDITLEADGPGGASLTFQVTSGPQDGTLSGTAPDLTYTPDAGFHGTDSFEFTASVGAVSSDPATVEITVVPEPPVAADVSATTDQEQAVVVTLDGSSSSGQPLTYHADDPDDGTVDLVGDGPDVTYTPDAGFHGTDTFDYHVNDGFNDSNTATVTVTVEPLPPVAHDQAVTVVEDTPRVVTLEADSPSGGALTYDYTQPSDGTVTGAGPDVTYTPDPGFLGADSFTFHVNDGFNDSDVATVTVSVAPEPPTAADVSEATDQDTPVSITLDGDSPGGHPLTYHYDQPDDGTVTGAGPDVTYTPEAGFFGEDTFTYHVNDGFNDSNTATVTVTVEPAPPVANDVSETTAFETPVVITLDGENPSGEPLVYEIVSQPANGTAVLDGDGPDVTYTPDPGFEADDDTFTYRVDDGFNDSNTATVTVSVEPEPPTAADVSESTDQDTPVVITLDGDSPSGQTLTYHYDQPDDGTVTGAGPDVTYTPDPGFFGEDTFTYHVNDGFTDSNTATVTVTVNFAAEDYDFDAVGNTLLEVGVAASGDPAVQVSATLLDDADPGFTVEAVDDSAASGSVDWDADGTFTYEPAAGFTGDDTFTYTIGDGDVSGTGTVTVTVSDLAWYVDGDASGDGRSWSPFATLGEAETASGTGDTIFVYEASGDYTGGIALQADQELLGEEAGLTMGGHDLVDPGDRPAIAPASGDAIGLASGAHVEGIDVTGGAGGGLVASGAGGAMTVTGVDLSGVTGIAVDLSGAGDFTLTDVDVTNSSGTAVSLDSLSGTLTHSGTTAQTGTATAVSITDPAASADLALDTVTSASSGIAVSGNDGAVAIASATLGSAGSRIDGDAAVDVSGGSGTTTVTSLSAHTQNVAAVDADGAGTVEIGGGSVDAQGAAALVMTSTDADVTLATATSASSSGHGIELTGVGGSIDLSGGSVTGSTGDAVHVDGGSVDLTAAVSVTNASGHGVRVNALSGGSVTLSGAVTDTGEGVELTGNTGSTVAFSGVLDVEPASGERAFVATGGGTVTATATGSTLDATNASALVVQDTTIGAAGLAFDSVAASNAVNGIDLDTTGSGPLTVAGDGSTNRNGAGGTITGMSGHGVALDSTGAVTLRNMTIADGDANAVRANGVAGLSVIAASITGNTDGGAADTRNSVYVREASGAVLLQDSLISDSAHNQVDVENSSGTVTVDVVDTEISTNVNNTGLQVEAIGTSDVTLNVSGSTFDDHHATGLHAFARGTATLTVDIDGNTFSGNNIAMNLASEDSASMFTSVTGNATSGHPSHSVNATTHDDALHEVTITGNDIDEAGMTSGAGIRLIIEDDSTMRARVEDNDVYDLTVGNGIAALARETAGQLHLVLRGNDVQSTSDSVAYNINVLDSSYMCGLIESNSGSSDNPGQDMLVDVFDTAASADIEGMTTGPVTDAEFETHLETENPLIPRITADTNGESPSNVSGVAADTCQRPS